jgi:hypothetical protein
MIEGEETCMNEWLGEKKIGSNNEWTCALKLCVIY